MLPIGGIADVISLPQLFRRFRQADPRAPLDSRERLPLQQGGCMTLAQLGLVLWDDLAAPVIAGILVSIIVSRMDNRK